MRSLFLAMVIRFLSFPRALSAGRGTGVSTRRVPQGEDQSRCLSSYRTSRSPSGTRSNNSTRESPKPTCGTPGVVLALRTRDFSVFMPNGERWDAGQSAAYVRAGFEQMERTLSLSFTMRELNVRRDTAAALIHQRWSRMQMKSGQARRVETTACQRETWVNSAAGWRLHLVDSIQPLVWTVDGRRVDPSRHYDPRARPYAQKVEPESPCTS